MSLLERGPRDGGQSDPSTSRSLRRLQDDPVRLASLLAGANSVVPRRRRRVGFLTASGATMLLLLSAVEAPNLFAAVGLTADHHIAADRTHQGTHEATGGTGPVTRAGVSTSRTRPAAAGGSPTTAAKTPPATRAKTVQPEITLAQLSPSGTPTALPVTHGKSKSHRKSTTGPGNGKKPRR